MLGASFLALCGVTAILSKNQDVFSYIRVEPWNQFRRSVIECEMCYKEACLTADVARCEYYALTSNILDESENEEIGEDVNYKIDQMLYDYVEKASSTDMLMSCLPLISQYTDCTEENICTGCRVCSCDTGGRWNCSVTRQCRPSPKVYVDHRVIGSIVERLRNSPLYENDKLHKIVKRSVSAESSLENKDIITREDITKWLYGAEPLKFEKELNSTDDEEDLKDGAEDETVSNTENNTVTTFSTTLLSDIDNDLFSPLNSTVSNKPSDTEILVFDDILQGLTVKDLKNDRSPNHNIDRKEMSYINLNNNLYNEKTNDIVDTDYDPIRLVKRDISENNKMNVTETVEKDNETASSNITMYNRSMEYFKVALFSVNQLIDDKQKEIEELINVQQNLVNFARLYTNSNFIVNATYNNTYDAKHHIIIYKMDALGECLAKFKQNIFNAIENITKRNVFENSALTKDLKVLLHAIKHYIHIEGNRLHRTNLDRILTSQEYKESLRRILEGRHLESFDAMEDVINIFKEINKMTPSVNTLNHLSENVRKIIKRVIKHLYLDEITPSNLVMNNNGFGIESYIESIGNNWQRLTQRVAISAVQDKLYNMKLLHVTLNADIGKIEDALSFINFAQTRRMTVANGALIEKSILRIKNNLKQINYRVEELMKSPQALRMGSNTMKKPKVKKLSMIQKLKKILNNSRYEVRSMLRRNLPKSEIMKRIAKKKMEELEKQKMLEREETMKRWQETLNIARRRKRSTWGFQNFIDRLKGIIPSYLRGKVKPAISKKRSNRTKSARTHDQKKKKQKTSPSKRRTTTQRPNEKKEKSLT